MIKAFRKYDSETVSKAVEMFKSGITTETIGEQLGAAGGYIRQWMRELSISRGNKRWPKNIKQKAVELYKDGHPVAIISRELGPPPRSIYDWLQVANCKRPLRIEKRLRHKRIRQTVIMQDWRLKVFERDGFGCVGCGQVGGKLQAHHILNFNDYPEYRTVLSNGITLCETCHYKLHGKQRRKHA